MSAQSSARSKRRQSALFSSHGRPSLLPLPQLSIHSVATSTPARGLQKHLPAPLPTPKAPASRLLSTPARGYDDNTTFFGFSPGVEANETALLAVDYRSVAGQHNEQNGDDLFDDTAVLEQRAFANRRTSHDGDTSNGGLGALIFSNLVAGGHTQDALERLELGKRRESSTSRNSEHTSPVKRNASFTVSIGGDYLVDYETDVRFGDDRYEKLQDNEADAEARLNEYEPVRIDLAPPSIHFTSSPAVRAYTPTSLDESPTDASPSAAQHIQSSQSTRQLPESPVPLPSDTLSPLLPTTPARSVQTSHTQEHLLHSERKDEPDAREQQQQPYLPESPAKSAVSVSAEPSPTMAERRQARRLRRGLTASMAILLSPVAEDKDREKSISRSRSMLAETVGSHSSMSHVLPPPVQEASPRITSQTETRREDHQVYTTVLHFGQKEPVPAEGPDLPEVQAELPHTSEHASGDNGRIASREPVSLASMLVASLSQSNIDVTDHELDHAPVASSSKEIAKEPSGSRNSQFAAKSRQRAASASLPAHTGPVIKKHIREPSNSQADAPSYLKPTLSRSIRQRQSAKTRQTEMSQRNSRIDASRAAKTVVKEVIHTTQPIRQPKQKTKPPLPPRPIQTQKPADIPAPTARIVKKKSIDDLFERRQRDGARVPALEHPQNCTSSSMNGKGKEEQSRADEIHMRPVAHQATLNPSSAAPDEALTVPRGFNFAAPRKRLRQESAAAPGPTSAPARVQVRRATAQPETGKAPCRKARRVLPEEQEPASGGDPEIGSGVALTGAALAAQEYMLEKREGQLAAEASKQTPSKSFDKTTQSQILQRYLQELADIEATYLEREDEVPRPRYPAANDPCISVGANVENASHPYRNANARPSPDEQHAKRRRVEASVNPETKQRTTAGVRSGTHQSATREPLRAVPIQRIESAVPPSKSNTNIRLQAPLVPAPLATFKEPIKSAPKVTDFTFQVVGQHQLSFQERLAAWQAREAEAARLGKPVLQPLALRPKDPIKEARKADKPVAATRKQPVIAKEFNWHSDKRARERKDWEERLREKEEILAELAEIKRLEAEAAEMESIKKMRAAQVPIAHPVPAFARSRKRRQHEMR